MADLFTDITTYLDASGLLDTTVSYDMYPDAPDYVVSLFEYGGSSPPQGVSGVSRSFQIVVRHKDAEQAYAKINEIYGFLADAGSIVYLTSDRWVQLSLKQPPFKIKVDDSARIYYGFNLVLNTYHD